jgi:tRNA 2-thiouridine synthesizing protein E
MFTSMNKRIFASKEIELTDEGYFCNPDQWSREVATAIALEGGITLKEKHFQIFEFLRTRYQTGHSLTIRSVTHSGIVTTREFFELFPEAPMKMAIRLAGIPKPQGCF